MDAVHTKGLSSPLRIRKQAEFITDLRALAAEGQAENLQAAALMFWRAYPKMSTTFARRVIRALERIGAPGCCFEAGLLSILARCHLVDGQTELACDYLAAARRIIAADAAPELHCLIEEFEIRVRLARSELAEAQAAWNNLEDWGWELNNGLSSEQLLLGTRLALAAGDLAQAARHALQAVECAVTDEQRCRAQLALLSVNVHTDGDIRRALMQLSSFEHSLRTRTYPALSAETKAQLLYQLTQAFIQQGKLGQVARCLQKSDLRSVDDHHPPELLIAALSLAEGHLSEARRQLRLLESRPGIDLCQTEYLDFYLRSLALSQALDGPAASCDRAQECYQLCATLDHDPLRQRACLLLASALIGSGACEQAACLLQESGLQASPHKLLRFVHGCLQALCASTQAAAGDEALPPPAAGAPEASLHYLAEQFGDEDLAFVIFLLVRTHPAFARLLAAEGLDQALSASARSLCGSGFFAPGLLAEGAGSAPSEGLPASPPLPAFQPSLEQTTALPVVPEDLWGSAGPDEALLASASDIGLSLYPAAPAQLPGCGQALAAPQDRALYIQLFGGLQVRRNGIALDLNRERRRKVRGLIVVLALGRGREIARDQVLEALWPAVASRRSINGFYVTWNALKEVFVAGVPKRPARLHHPPDRFPFSSVHGRCALLTEYCGLDLDDFDCLMHQIKDAVRCGRSARCLELAAELLLLYKGDVLPADLYSDQLDQVRLHYRKAFIETILLATRTALMSHQSAAALPFIERGLAVDPSCEELYRLAMHAYALEGRRDDSLRSYYLCRKNLAEELGIEPSAELKALFTRLVAPPPSSAGPQLPERLQMAVGE